MADRAAKAALFDAFSSVAKALGNGRRAEIVDVLAQSERSVEDLAAEIGQSVANTSHHLQQLAAAGLVKRRREGTWIFYRLASERVEQLWAALRDVAAEHVVEVTVLSDGYLGDRSGIELVTADELAERLTKGRVVVLDVRPQPEFDAAHIDGARSIPYTELESRLHELPRSSEIVAYCRGPYCVYADDAVRLLKVEGFKARRLDDGLPEWKRAGRAVTSTQPADGGNHSTRPRQSPDLVGQD
jgi:DNA-binding transcriptional ArsR family regulator/rhodanese-related sulfurtransferase